MYLDVRSEGSFQKKAPWKDSPKNYFSKKIPGSQKNGFSPTFFQCNFSDILIQIWKQHSGFLLHLSWSILRRKKFALKRRDVTVLQYLTEMRNPHYTGWNRETSILYFFGLESLALFKNAWTSLTWKKRSISLRSLHSLADKISAVDDNRWR